jgi:hypothetical protein
MIQIVLFESGNSHDKPFFKKVKDFEVPQVPARDDIIMADVDGEKFAFKVLEVHYSDNPGVELYTQRVGSASEYLKRINRTDSSGPMGFAVYR